MSNILGRSLSNFGFHPPSGVTSFFAGALGAGGYGSSLIMASDGSAMTLRNDTGCSWLWSRSTNKWKNSTSTPGMTTISATTPLESVFAPSNPNIMYMVYAAPLPVQGPGGGSSVVRNYLWKSTDKGVTWTRPNTTIAISGDNGSAGNITPKFVGPRMAVDPNNADVCYIVSASGAVYVTYDGGTTISLISGLLAAFKSAVVSGSAPAAGSSFFTVVANPLAGGPIKGPPSELGYFGFDPTWPLALGTNGQNDALTATGAQFTGSIAATTLTVSAMATTVPVILPSLIQGHSGSGIAANTNMTAQITKGTFTASIGATFTGTGAGTNLTTTSVVGIISIGDTITGTGVPGSTTIVSQTSGPTGGAGVYVTNNSTTSSGAALTAASTVLNVTSAPNLGVIVGNVISGTGVTGGTTINSQTSGTTNGAGLYVVSVSQTVASTTIFDVQTSANLPGGAAVGDTYFVVASGSYFIWNGSAWVSPNNGLGGLLDIGQYTVSVSQTVSSTLIDQLTLKIQTLQSRDGGSGATSIGVGDTIYFGAYGSVCVDGSSDTIANPGGTGVISKYVYVSWMSGSANIWRTTNGGVGWSAMSGGPAAVRCKMKMSNDSVLAGGGFNSNILYVCDQFGTLIWRYVENPPTGSGLSSTTWTQVSTGLTSAMVAVAIHPTVAGKLASLNNGGGQFLSTDYGTTWAQANASAPGFTIVSGAPGIPPNGTDTPWLTAVPDISAADIEYDRGSGSDPTRCWIADGIGVLYSWPTTFISGVAVTAITKDATGAVVTLGTNDWPIGQSFIPTGVGGMTEANGTYFFIQALPPTGGLTAGQVKTNVNSFGFSNFTGAGTASIGNTLVSQNEVMDSLTMQKIVKCPTPSGRVLMACQDRQIMSSPNVTTYPTTFFPPGFPNNPMDVTYSKADPLTVWAGISDGVYVSTDGGATFPNAKVLATGQAMVASIAASNCVVVPRPGANIQHTTDGGSTWHDCLFAGSAIDGTSPAPFLGGTSYWIVCDDFGNYYYWNQNDFKFWKSTDGGANFTLQSTTNFNPSSGGAHSDGSTFCCPPGVNGEVWFCPGQLGSWIFKVVGYFSTDSGQTWTAMNQAGDPQNLFHLAFGKAKPGGTGYPAAFMSGFMTDPTTAGLWRCDDPKSASRVWVPINGFRNVSPEGDRYLEADREVYGTVYQATFSTGYIYGTIS